MTPFSFDGMNVRLVATDIDGTIVPSRGTVSDRTRSALEACDSVGITVVLVTGRPPRWMPPVLEATGVHGTAICANGAVTLNAGGLELGSVIDIAPDRLVEAIGRLRRVVPDAVFAAEAPWTLRATAAYERYRKSRRQEAGLAPLTRDIEIVGGIDDILQGPRTFKVMVAAPRLTPDELLTIGCETLGDLVSVTRSVIGESAIELGPLGVSKASTLAGFAAERGIDMAEVIAFGDMPNDVEMLAAVGRGFAMADGHPDAVAAAAAIAPPAEEDGVAQVLEAMLARTAVA